MVWAESEMMGVDLGDKRLNRRAAKLLSELGRTPNENIPSSCRGWAETKAAYRFFNNDKVTSERILSPHREATLRRMACYVTILLVQDTTQLNYSGQKQKSGIGPLNRDNHRGILLHPTIAVTDGGLCLGVLDDLHWYRKNLHHQSQHEKNRINIKTPISEKESYRFVRGYQLANQISKKVPNTRLVSIS